MNSIYITAEDLERLRLILMLTPYTHPWYRQLEALRQELDRATIIHDPEQRPNVVTMGSTFTYFDLDCGATEERRLCFPHEVETTIGGLSIVSPFGIAVIGCSAGDEVRWSTAVGTRRVLLRRVAQPTPAAACARRAENFPAPTGWAFNPLAAPSAAQS